MAVDLLNSLKTNRMLPACSPVSSTATGRSNSAETLMDLQPLARDLAKLCAHVCTSSKAADRVLLRLLRRAPRLVQLAQAGLTLRASGGFRLALQASRTGDSIRSSRRVTWAARLAMNW